MPQWTVLQLHIKVLPVSDNVVTGPAELLHDGGRHDVPEDEDSLPPEGLPLLSSEKEGGRGVGGGGVVGGHVAMAQGRHQAPQEGPEHHRENQHQDAELSHQTQ